MIRTPEETDDAHDDEVQVRRRQREVEDLRRDEDTPSFQGTHAADDSGTLGKSNGERIG